MLRQSPLKRKRQIEECDSIITLNIGGQLFQTMESTLKSRGEHYFSALLSGRCDIVRDANETIFVDRSPIYFHHVLNYLRMGVEVKHTLPVEKEGRMSLLQEAIFYGFGELVNLIRGETRNIANFKVEEFIFKTHDSGDCFSNSCVVNSLLCDLNLDGVSATLEIEYWSDELLASNGCIKIHSPQTIKTYNLEPIRVINWCQNKSWSIVIQKVFQYIERNKLV